MSCFKPKIFCAGVTASAPSSSALAHRPDQQARDRPELTGRDLPHEPDRRGEHERKNIGLEPGETAIPILPRPNHIVTAHHFDDRWSGWLAEIP
jgi:hypothetical protein